MFQPMWSASDVKIIIRRGNCCLLLLLMLLIYKSEYYSKMLQYNLFDVSNIFMRNIVSDGTLPWLPHSHMRKHLFLNSGGVLSHDGSSIWCAVHKYLGRFKNLTAVVMKSTIFWNIMTCSLLKLNRCFGRAYHLHLQGWKISQARYQCES
jgi:hypothetical protein